MKNIYALLVLDLDSGLPVLNRSYMDDFDDHDNIILFSAAFSAINSLLDQVKVGKVKFLSTFEYNICISSNDRFACVGVIPPTTVQMSTQELLNETLMIIENNEINDFNQISDNLSHPFNLEIDKKITEFNSNHHNSIGIDNGNEFFYFELDPNLGFISHDFEDNKIDSPRIKYLTAWINNIWRVNSEKDLKKEFSFIDIINNEFIVNCSIKEFSNSKIGALIFCSDLNHFKDVVFTKHIYSINADEIFHLISQNEGQFSSQENNEKKEIAKILNKFKKTFSNITGRNLIPINEIFGIEELGNIFNSLLPKLATHLITGHPLAITGEKENSIPIIYLLSSLLFIKDYSLVNFDSEFNRIALFETGNNDLLEEFGYEFLGLETKPSDFEVDMNKYLERNWSDIKNLSMINKLEEFQSIISYIWDNVFNILSSKNYLEISQSFEKDFDKLVVKILNWINPILYPLKDKKENKNLWW